MTTITLSSNYGYSPYYISKLPAYSLIDASRASWTLSNSQNSNPDAYTSYNEGSGQLNLYPFRVYDSANVTIRGGSIWGEVPQYSDWKYTYNNSAAILVKNAPGAIIDDWRIDKAWDAIRIGVGSSNFLIDDAYVTNTRDDGVENDDNLSGTIRDSMFDGVFSGISLGDGDMVDGSMNTVTLEGVFIRNKSYLYEGKFTHVSPFKANSSAPETTPDLRIINSVFAIEDPNHLSQGRLAIAWENVVESRGNVFLNLSDTPLPSSYPKPPAGFTILQGQQARDYWEACKAAWLNNHDGTPVADITPLPPLPGSGSTTTAPPPTTTTPTTPTPPPTTTAPSPDTTGSANVINGTNSSNSLTGTSGVDHINGLSGDDKIFGMGGADVLAGGSGRDKFVFNSQMDGTIDTITDFDPRYDYIYLDNNVFTNLGSGSLSSPRRLSSSYFEEGDGVKPNDSNDYILYDTDSGLLSYDADGNGSGAAVAIAQLTPGLNLSQYDIYVV